MTDFEQELSKYRTFREWLTTELADSLSDIASHGADSGYHGLTYNRDIDALLEEYEDEIIEIVESTGPVMEVFQHYLNRTKQSFSLDALRCWLVWSAAELVAGESEG